MTGPLHDVELVVDTALVRELLRGAAASVAELPLHRLAASGSSNTLYRLGEELLVRLPRQVGGSAGIRTEARWGSWLAPRLPVPCPEVVVLGEPAPGYPASWSVVRWLPGRTPSVPAEGAGLARDLAGLVRAVRAVDVPAAALADPALKSYRGEALAHLDEDLGQAVDACRALPGLDLDLELGRRVWDRVVAIPPPERAPSWLHGDLLAENLLVHEGGLAAVLDLGGLGVGDPTVDLVVAWEVLGDADREVFRTELEVEDDTWLLGAGWALLIATLTFPYYWHTMPARCQDRPVMARAVLEALA